DDAARGDGKKRLFPVCEPEPASQGGAQGQCRGRDRKKRPRPSSEEKVRIGNRQKRKCADGDIHHRRAADGMADASRAPHDRATVEFESAVRTTVDSGGAVERFMADRTRVDLAEGKGAAVLRRHGGRARARAMEEVQCSNSAWGGHLRPPCCSVSAWQAGV